MGWCLACVVFAVWVAGFVVEWFWFCGLVCGLWFVALGFGFGVVCLILLLGVLHCVAPQVLVCWLVAGLEPGCVVMLGVALLVVFPVISCLVLLSFGGFGCDLGFLVFRFDGFLVV